LLVGRGGAGADDSIARASHDLDDEENAGLGRRPDRDEAIWVQIVGKEECVGIHEGRHGFLERNAVLGLVAGCLGGVPLEVAFDDCTHEITMGFVPYGVKPKDAAWGSGQRSRRAVDLQDR